MTEIVAKRKWRYPMAYERSYAKYLTAYVERKMKTVKIFLPDMVGAVQASGKADNIGLVLDRINLSTESAEQMTRVMKSIFGQVERYSKNEFDAITKSVFGVPLDAVAAVKQDAAVDPQELERLWVDENLDLIKSIDADTLARIKRAMNDAITDNVDSGQLTKYLIKKLQDIANIERNRAALIGTDQVGKLNGRITQYQQEHAGLTSYIWETCHDERVRRAHRLRAGHRYYWSNPPPDGHPGMPIRCRCVALPVIDIDKVPIRTIRGTFVYVTAETVPSLKAPDNNSQDLETNTSVLKAAMPEDDYKAYTKMIQARPDIAKLYNTAGNPDSIAQAPSTNIGRYYDSIKRIEYRFGRPEHVKKGMSKYSTVAHEHGHYFDHRLQYDGLTHKEMDALAKAINPDWIKFKHRASNSDQFLKAIREDMPGLKEFWDSHEWMTTNMAEDLSSVEIQDTIDGLFPEITPWWGHSEKYWNRGFAAVEGYEAYKDLKKAYQQLGFKVTRKEQVKRIYRQYEAASETWAEIMSAATVNPKSLEWYKKYMPHTYKAFCDIIKAVETK